MGNVNLNVLNGQSVLSQQTFNALTDSVLLILLNAKETILVLFTLHSFVITQPTVLETNLVA
jgi:hypothetical protein